MTIFNNKKIQQELDETREELFKTRKALREVYKSKETLDSFLAWMQWICAEKNWQFAGVYKIKSKFKSEYKEDYVGFIIKKKNLEWNESRTHFFTVRGYLCSGSRMVQEPCYKAHLHQNFSEIPKITNTLEIVENYTGNPIDRSRGIGSYAMTVIKNLAKELHCSSIKAKRVPRKPEDEERLQKFYAKNKFHQEDGSEQICFDMIEYKCKLGDYPPDKDLEPPMTQEELETERMILLCNRLIRSHKYDQLVLSIQNKKHRYELMKRMRIIKD